MKNINEIRHLLDKFYCGETSIEEECTLSDFFLNFDDIPKDLLADKLVFESLNQLSTVKFEDTTIPNTLEDNLIAIIEQKSQKANHKKIIWKRIIGVAAMALIISLLGIFTTPKPGGEFDQPTHTNVYIPQTEEEIVADTSRAFIILSNEMHETDMHVNEVSMKFNNAEY